MRAFWTSLVGIGLILFPASVVFADETTECAEIKTRADLEKIRLNPAGSYCLGNDIDVYRGRYSAPLPELTGSFDGRGFAIRRLMTLGLFNSIAASGRVSNLRILGARVKSIGRLETVGILTGRNAGRIENVHVSGFVTAEPLPLGASRASTAVKLSGVRRPRL